MNCIFLTSVSFLENGTDEKFWKHFQMFLLVRPIDWVIFPLIYSAGCDWVPCLDTFIAFFSLPATFLENGMSQKFWKKFQIFLLVASFDGVNFKIFHLKHHTWKNNNQIAKTGNFGPLNLGNPLWSRQSANVGLLLSLIHISEPTRPY